MSYSNQEKLFTDYHTKFMYAANIVADAEDQVISSLLSQVDNPYVCGHMPCCKACYFNDPQQMAFEDELARMIYLNELNIDKILSNTQLIRKYDNLGARIIHFFSSPKYSVVVTAVNLAPRKHVYLVSINWAEALVNAAKFRCWFDNYTAPSKRTGIRKIFMNAFSSEPARSSAEPVDCTSAHGDPEVTLELMTADGRRPLGKEILHASYTSGIIGDTSQPAHLEIMRPRVARFEETVEQIPSPSAMNTVRSDGEISSAFSSDSSDATTVPLIKGARRGVRTKSGKMKYPSTPYPFSKTK